MKAIELGRAFIRSVRTEGLSVATRKVRRYFSGPALPGASTGAAQAQTYWAQTWKTLSSAGTFLPGAEPQDVFARKRVAVIADLNLPQCKKYRVDQFIEICNMLDIDVSISHYLDIPRCFNIMQDATHLFEYRLPLDKKCLEYRYEARRLGLPIMYDIDDPLFSFPAYATYSNMKGVGSDLHARFLDQTVQYLEMMNSADALCVSTPGLQAHLSQLTRRPICVRRNFADKDTLETGKAVLARRSQNKLDCFTVAFASGSLGHEHDFAVASEELFEFLRSYDASRLLIIGHFPKDAIPDDIAKRTVFEPFSGYAEYLEQLARADCMIAPLTDDLFNSCKSAVRIIDAASVGTPTIASDIGDNNSLVIEGETGFLAQGPGDWGRALERLFADREMTASLGQAARRNLEENWCLSSAPHVVAPELIDWLQG